MVAMAWALFMDSLLSGLPGHDQNGGDETHGGDQEHILAENQQAGGGGGHTHNGREVVPGAEPLLHKDSDKQGCQDEFDALKIQGQQISGQGAQGGTGHPPALVEEGYQ